MVRDRGLEPLTPSVSRKCSTSELTAHRNDAHIDFQQTRAPGIILVLPAPNASRICRVRAPPCSIMLENLRSNRKLAFRSRVLAANPSASGSKPLLPSGRGNLHVQRGATQRYSCNQCSCHASSIRLPLRRAETTLSPSTCHGIHLPCGSLLLPKWLVKADSPYLINWRCSIS